MKEKTIDIKRAEPPVARKPLRKSEPLKIRNPLALSEPL